MRPISILVGYAAGGVVDISACTLVSKAERFLGQPMILENKPGAGSNLAVGIIDKSKPDGYTLAALTQISRASPWGSPAFSFFQTSCLMLERVAKSMRNLRNSMETGRVSRRLFRALGKTRSHAEKECHNRMVRESRQIKDFFRSNKEDLL